MKKNISNLINLLSFALALHLSVISQITEAHFSLNLNIRILHIEHSANGASLYMRLPLSYLLADKAQHGIDPYSGKIPYQVPYTRNSLENDRLVHYVDVEQFTIHPEGLGNIAAAATHILSTDQELKGHVKSVRLYPIGNEPAFATLAEAKRALSNNFVQRALNNSLHVSDTLVDIHIHYPTQQPLEEYQLFSSLNPGLPDQENTANLILSYNPGKIQIFRSRGLMREPVQIRYSSIDAINTFLKEGMVHIIQGLDHVLFVLCLSLGALALPLLFWRVTAFTIGHSITLSVGFFGFIPNTVWFVPLIETGIAISIIYIAWLSMRQKSITSISTERTIFLTSLMLGLLHGLGFSFVLHEILNINSPNIWQSLLAFNLGVEAGQILIILAIWPLLYLARLRQKNWESNLRYTIATICCAIALLWTFERGYELVNVIQQENQSRTNITISNSKI
ncbi:HupE/UreJ family protein [Microbulbifer sp. PSTR4-B]|uniref:HupE/UreJ family protein n=1 Tax=unclassified Microbulbifer TaxID=2619833 RepID=UPI00403B24A9